jgi:O-antigen/teichoic acid export membrane protein
LRRLASPALANIGLQLAQALNVQGMVLVVGTVLGPLAVVVFSTLRTLTRLILHMVLAVSHAAEPELAEAYGTGDQHLLQSLFVNTLRAGFWLGLAAALGLALFGSLILELWTQGKVAMNSALFHWLLISGMASVVWYGALTLLKSANRHLRASFLYSLSAAAAVALAGALLMLTGRLSDAGVALLLMDAAMAAYTLRAACATIGIRVQACVARAINPFPILHLLVREVHVH